MARLSKEFRYAILVRDGFVCQFCGVGGKTSDFILEVHHIIWRRFGGTNDPNNLILTCVVCHDKIHYGKWTGRPTTFTELKRNQGRD